MWLRSECSKVSDCLWDYSARRLSTAETAQIERHLQQCVRCQAEAEACRHTVGMLSAARSRPVPLSQKNWHDLRPALAAGRRSADFLPRLTLAGAGTALAATLLVVFFGGSHSPTKSYNTNPSGGQQTAPSSGENLSPPDVAVANHESQQGGHGLFSSGLGFGAFFPGFGSQSTGPLEKPGPPAALSPSPPHHSLHPHSARSGAGHTRPAPTAPDYVAQLDGSNVTPRSQPRNFVLNPVVSSTDEEPAHRYVMGSIPAAPTGVGAAASAEGTEDGGAW